MSRSIAALFVKRRAGEPMARVAALRGIDGVGFAGDAAASAPSPRQVLVVGSEDLRALGVGDAGLRANIVVEGSVRDLSSGDVVRIGTVWLRLTMRCEACGRLNDERPGLSRDAGIRRGMLARVLSSGHIGEGDAVVLAEQRLRPLSDDWHERVGEIMRAVPAGKVVTYAALAEVAGVQRVYCRALPVVLDKAARRGVPAHRAVPAKLERVSPQAARLLTSEGVPAHAPLPHWETAAFHANDELAFRGELATASGASA